MTALGRLVEKCRANFAVSKQKPVYVSRDAQLQLVNFYDAQLRIEKRLAAADGISQFTDNCAHKVLEIMREEFAR